MQELLMKLQAMYAGREGVTVRGLEGEVQVAYDGGSNADLAEWRWWTTRYFSNGVVQCLGANGNERSTWSIEDFS